MTAVSAAALPSGALAYDVEQVRRDFPILSRRINGQPLAFLDSAASAQKPEAVIEAMATMMRQGYANIHRGVYTLSQEATQAFEAARATVARFVNAPHVDEIVFTRNTTESINLVAHAWARHVLRDGDEIVITALEHHANIVPWHLLKRERAVVLKVIPVLADGQIDLDAALKLIGPRTRLLAVTQLSNALGTRVPMQPLIAQARAVGAAVLIDGSQGILHGQVDLAQLGADFYVFTGHKIYGPSGIGVLWGRREILADMPPWQGGGDMIETVTFEDSTFAAPPARFEAGTPAIVEAVGLAAALDYVTALGRDRIEAHEARLLDYATRQLQSIDGLRIIGTAQDKAAVISFTVDGTHPADLGMILDKTGVAVRTGHHCAMPLMAQMGVGGTVRASLALYTNTTDIDRLVAGLAKAVRLLRE